MALTEKIFLEDLGSYLSKLAEKSPNVYWLSSEDFKKIEYISPAFEEIWGCSREILYEAPHSWIDFLHPEDKKDHHPIDAMRICIEKKGALARYEETYRIVRPDGGIRWILDRGFPVLDHMGNCCGVTGVAIDITKEKQFERALAKAKEEAEAASRAKTDFLMNMSHDFRTPFNGLLGLADMLERQEQDPKKKHLLGIITQSAHTLLNLHNDIFEFAKLENGLVPVLDKPFNLIELLIEQKKMLLPSAQKKGLGFRVDWESDLPVILVGDKMRLQRILMNLVTNAIKFTGQGEVRVNASVVQRRNREVIIQFVVSDTGCGIAQDKQDFIFERFTRVSSAYTGGYSGLGFGLRFVKRYVEDLEGEIRVYSQPNNGSQFTILIPFTRPLV